MGNAIFKTQNHKHAQNEKVENQKKNP